MGAFGRGVVLEPDAQQPRDLQTTEIFQQQKEIRRTRGARERQRYCVAKPVDRLHAQPEQDVDGQTAHGERQKVCRQQRPNKALCELRAGKRLECEGWVLLKLRRCAAVQEGAGICGREGFEAAGHVSLELIA